jgi:hypothetical protein
MTFVAAERQWAAGNKCGLASSQRVCRAICSRNPDYHRGNSSATTSLAAGSNSYLYVSESGESPIAPIVAGFNCPFGCNPRPC